MSNEKITTYSEVVKELMGKKSYLLSKAQAFSEIGMNETAQPLFLSAGAYEERIAALLDSEERELEAAIHRISAASCYAKADRLSHAVTLYRAALVDSLHQNTRVNVLRMLTDCLAQVTKQLTQPAAFSPLLETVFAG